jgi:mannitol/fructose-specific phosphotransferase system IIA component (Ntr-type)
MKIQNKEEITFEKYWKKVNEIITTIEIPKNTKIQENLNKFIDKITNKFIQKELIRYLLDHCEYSEFEVEIEKIELPTSKTKSVKTK